MKEYTLIKCKLIQIRDNKSLDGNRERHRQAEIEQVYVSENDCKQVKDNAIITLPIRY